MFYKDFNSIHPQPATAEELKLLGDIVEKEQPVLVGLSVMSSMYLETVDKVIAAVRARTDAPFVCGGAYATMFPERFLDMEINFVIRTDGEIPVCRPCGSHHGHTVRL